MGYLSELTAHERLTVDNATIDIFAAFENGSGLIYEVWERYFSDRVQKEIESRELAFIGQILWAAYDLMSDAIRDYHLMLGHYCFWFSSTASISCYSAACNSTSWWITRSRRSSTLS